MPGESSDVVVSCDDVVLVCEDKTTSNTQNQDDNIEPLQIFYSYRYTSQTKLYCVVKPEGVQWCFWCWIQGSAPGETSVYKSFKASESGMSSGQRYLVDRLASGALMAEFSGIKVSPGGVTQHVGTLPENSNNNRHKQMLPYDKNRIVLQDGYAEDSATDHVNASYITGICSSKQYIATQGPRPDTVVDFWRMVWEEQARHVVMLTNISIKCDQYWPDEEGVTQTYGPVKVTTTHIQCRDDFFVRTFRIKRHGSEDPREVTQYHFTSWSEHDVPMITSLVRFYRYVSGKTGTSVDRAAASPVVVHCSAGVGQTGTYIGLDIGIGRLVKDGNVDCLDLVTSLRKERRGMVKTAYQYKFLHKALLEAYSAHGTNMSVDAFEELFPDKIDSESPHPRLDKEFETLQQMSTLQPEKRHATSRHVLQPEEHQVEAGLEEHRDKVKEPAVLPYKIPADSPPVNLKENTESQNQFFNAVFLPTLRDSRGFVVTQLPLPDTLVDFWRLVCGSGITTVVCLCAPNEPFCQYWPIDDEASVKSGPYDVTLLSKIKVSKVTTYSLNVGNEEDAAQPKSLQLLHYKGWTGEVGGRSSDILHLIDTLDTNRLVVQCSDGVRKSGLFCTLLNVVDRMTFDREVDVYMTIRHLQSGMPKAISSAVQYRYCYEVVQSRVRAMASMSPGPAETNETL